MRTWIWVFVLILALGCAGDKESDHSHSHDTNGRPVAQTPSESPEGVSRSPITELISKPQMVDGVWIRPAFDQAGREIEYAAKRGETFAIYVIAQYPEGYLTSAAQFRVILPAGVTLLYTKKFEDNSMSIGNPEVNYSITYSCHEYGEWYLLELLCKAEEEFDGGTVIIEPGVSGSGSSYLGYTDCGSPIEKLPGAGGEATLTRR